MKKITHIIWKIIPLKGQKIIDKYLYTLNSRVEKKKKAIEIRKSHNKRIQELKHIDEIKVVFLLIHDSIWKYEVLYKMMLLDVRFDPLIIVCPYVDYGVAEMQRVMQQSYMNFSDKGYNVIKSYDVNGEWLDVKNVIKPDIVFFTNPHKLTRPEYCIDNFIDVLTCYTPYAFVVIHELEMHYNQDMQNYVWKHFVETKHHFKYAKRLSSVKARNVVVSGFPGVDKIFDNQYTPQKQWKETKTRNTLKLIWAPHHTIPGQGYEFDYSSFHLLCDYFIDLLEKREDIQIAFKPHPILKAKLYNDKEWGREKTDAYYEKWEQMPNGQLEEGEYIDLFVKSDAMIMDSASFLAEYLYFNKPLCFTMRDEGVKLRFNTFGQMIFDYIYLAKTTSEVEKFIYDIVEQKNDYLKEKRNDFLLNTILPKNGKTASENIFENIKNELCKTT